MATVCLALARRAAITELLLLSCYYQAAINMYDENNGASV